MNQLIHFKGAQIRTAGTKDEPLLSGADVCKMLDLRNSRQVLARIPREDIHVRTVDTKKGPRQMIFVTESGFYDLVFQSRKQEAIAFRRWVCKRVLPAIRKHGYFVADRDDHPADLLALPDARRERILLWIAVMQEISASEHRFQTIKDISARHPHEKGFRVASLYRRFKRWERSGGDWKTLTTYVRTA